MSKRQRKRDEKAAIQATHAPKARPSWHWVLLVFCVALLPRLIHLAAVRNSPFLAVPLIDAWEHDSTARAIAAGAWLWQKPLFKAPGYLYWLAIVYAFTGGSMGAALLLQMLLGAYSAVVVFILGRRLLGLQGGLVTALLFAFYGVAIHHATYLEIINLELPLCLTALWVLLIASDNPVCHCSVSSAPPDTRSTARLTEPWHTTRRTPLLPEAGVHRAALGKSGVQSARLTEPWHTLKSSAWGWWLLAGLLLGLSAATRPPVLFFVPLALLWCYWQAKDRRLAFRSIALILAGLSIVIAPIALRNRLVLREPILISANGGINFFIGNNADFEHTISIQPGYEWQKMEREPVRMGQAKSVSESQTWFYNKAWEFVGAHPVAWLGLLGRKALIFLSARELSRNYSWDSLRGESLILRWPLVGFAFVLPLSLLSLARRIRNRHWDGPIVLLLLFGLSVVFVNVFYFPDSRYRLPLVPVLCILSAESLLWGRQMWTHGRRREVLGYGLAAAAISGVMWLDLGSARSLENWPQDFYLARVAHTRAVSAQQAGDRQAAQEYQEEALSGYRKAIQQGPRNVDAYNNLASLLLARQENEAALDVCGKGLAVDGGYMELLANEGVAEYRLGHFQDSVTAFRKASEAGTGQLKVLYFLARSEARAGDLDGAMATLVEMKRLRFTEWVSIEQEPAFGVLKERGDYQRIRF